MNKKTKQLWILFAIMLCVGCSQPSIVVSDSGERTSNQLTQLSESQQVQRDDAVVAKARLFQALLDELTYSISNNGVAKSIEVCKVKAKELAKTVSKECSLKIGRTSFSLRNDQNTPPAWAVSFVKDRVENEVNIDLGEGSLGVLLPIRLKDACIKCHGQSDAIDANVNVAILTHYPNDMATGFAVGDLRGYFWIEVPPVPTRK